MKGRENKVDSNVLQAYVNKTAAQVRAIQSSLDQGTIGLSGADLRRPSLEVKELKEPSISKTPYTDVIAAASAFVEEVKVSEIANKGTKDYANGVAKSMVLPRHLKDVKQLSVDQHEREVMIARNIELVRARAQDLE